MKNRTIELLDSIESTDEDIRNQTDDEIFMLQKDSQDDSSSSGNNDDQTPYPNPTICVYSKSQSINVLLREKHFILKIQDKVKDPIVRKEYLLKLKDIVVSEQTKPKVEPFNFNNIMEHFKIGTKPVTFQDLQ